MTARNLIVNLLDAQSLASDVTVEIGGRTFEIDSIVLPVHQRTGDLVLQIDTTPEVIAEAIGATMKEE